MPILIIDAPQLRPPPIAWIPIRLQFNILDHTLVPNMRILNTKEEDEFMKNHQIKSKSQLPEISRFDPQALVVGLRPGNICHIQRPSITALTTDYYRICV